MFADRLAQMENDWRTMFASAVPPCAICIVALVLKPRSRFEPSPVWSPLPLPYQVSDLPFSKSLLTNINKML